MSAVVVYHSYYGCDTGCCGHRVDLEDGLESKTFFIFDHPYDKNPLKFAKKMVRDALGEEHVADLDWDNCVIIDD